MACRSKTKPRISTPRRGPSRERDSGVVGELRHPCARANRSAIRRGPSGSSGMTLASTPGRRPSSPWPRTIRDSTESTVAGSHRSDWHPDQCQHTFWRLCWGFRVQTYQICPQWPIQQIALTFSPAWETLSAEEQLEFEEHQEQLIKEAKAKFLANFKVDRNNKVVRQLAIDLALLRPAAATPKVSDTNKLQSLKAYIDEQRDQMQHIKWGIQNDYKRLVRAFDKSIVANFPSHEVESRENMCYSSTTGCHGQSQPFTGY
jgi:hypothetical protein